MTNQKHLITPPPKLVEQWVSLACEYEGNGTWIDLATEAARWGADEELKACCKWADEIGWTGAGGVLRRSRRPTSRSLKKQALAAHGAEPLPETGLTGDTILNVKAIERHRIIRKALETLND